jgi:hypothetical protein
MRKLLLVAGIALAWPVAATLLAHGNKAAAEESTTAQAKNVVSIGERTPCYWNPEKNADYWNPEKKVA